MYIIIKWINFCARFFESRQCFSQENHTEENHKIMKKQKLINLEGKKKWIMSLLFLKKNGCQMLTPDYRCNYTSDYRFMF